MRSGDDNGFYNYMIVAAKLGLQEEERELGEGEKTDGTSASYDNNDDENDDNDDDDNDDPPPPAKRISSRRVIVIDSWVPGHLRGEGEREGEIKSSFYWVGCLLPVFLRVLAWGSRAAVITL